MNDSSNSTTQRLGSLSKGKAKLLEFLLSEKSRKANAITPYPRNAAAGDSLLPASAAQQRLWFIDQLEGGRASYHIPMAVRLRGSLDEAALQCALDTLVQRHEVLRTVFLSEQGVLRQKISAVGRVPLRQVDLSEHEAGRREELVRMHENEVAQAPFDLGAGPLMRCRLLRIGAQEHVLLITMHHIISDGWSMDVISRELSELYAAYLCGREHSLQPLAIQYADYAQWHQEWLQAGTLEKQLSYWRDRMAGAAPHLDLPTDRARPATQSYRGKSIRVGLGARLSADLKAFAQQHEMTLFMVLCTGWAILLSKLSGQEDVVIGTPVANRQRPELENLIGFFVNTLALRIRAPGDLPLMGLLKDVREITLEAYDNQDVPFEQLVEALQPQRSLSRNPVFQVMLAVQNAPQSGLCLTGLDASAEEDVSEPAKFDLLLALQEYEGEIVGSLSYAADLFDPETVERWMACFTTLLQGMLANVHSSIIDLPILPEAERRRVLTEFNDTQTAYPGTQLVHRLFEEQVERTPELTAARFGDQELTYVELNTRANRLAHALSSFGVKPDDRVALYLHRGLDMVVGLLAILKAAGAYVPIDIRYPSERIDHVLRDSAPAVVITQDELKANLPATQARVITLDSDEDHIASFPAQNPDAARLGVSPEHLAYVIYTSGSTGVPKGVMVEHRNLINLIRWHCASFGLHEGDLSSCVAALGFDAATWEIWPSLSVGATLIIASSEVIADAEAFLMWWSSQPLDVSFLPTPIAELALSRNVRPPTLRTLLVGGDRLTQCSPDDSFDLVNNYGPTEATVLATSGRVCAEDNAIHIGRPMANARVYILDRCQRPVPIGVTAELYIAGAGVARGYLNRPELSTQRFVPDPFAPGAQARMYRTGDLARWCADGTIEFLGRNDEQVKIRGYRIELGEIEAQLGRHVQVSEAAVVAREDAHGEKRLVAYFTARSEVRPTAERLRAFLKEKLPDYMIPSAFVELRRLPLTSHGKVDRNELPAPDADAYAQQNFEAPQGEAETTLAGIWQRELQVERVGRHDNFFELGGHSMLAVRVLYEINRALGCNLKVIDTYRNPTILELASYIRGGRAADELVDLTSEAVLDERIVALEGRVGTPVRKVLLTGGTGFVGRFLLAQLLKDTEATVYCLVRSPSQAQATARVRTTLMQWDLWREEFESRVVAVQGDLRLPRLGVDSRTYEMLGQDMDSIYHCGTSMNHLETYAMAKAANVEAAKELLSLATSHRPKQINYISTLSIFTPSIAGAARVVNEDSPIDAERHRHSQGYVASKWVAEKIFMEASARGIPCNIFRMGLIWADTEQGRYDELQHVYRVIKSCLLSGYGIENHRYEMAPTPVDYAVRAVVFLAGRHLEGGRRFHIASSHQPIDGLFERCNEVLGTALELKSYYGWVREIKRLHEAGQSLPAVPVLGSAFSMDEESFTKYQRSQSGHVNLDCARTHQELECAGIVAPVLDDELLKVSLEDMYSRDADLREVAARRDGSIFGSPAGAQQRQGINA